MDPLVGKIDISTLVPYNIDALVGKIDIFIDIYGTLVPYFISIVILVILYLRLLYARYGYMRPIIIFTYLVVQPHQKTSVAYLYVNVMQEYIIAI